MMMNISKYLMVVSLSLSFSLLLTSCGLGEEKADMVILDSSQKIKKHSHKKKYSSEDFVPLSSSQGEKQNEKPHSLVEGNFNGQTADIAPQIVTPDAQVTYGANNVNQ